MGSRWPWGFLLSALALVGCTVTKPVVKIGLVAPFEGVYRDVGYDALYAVKLALREWNGAGGVEGYMVELVALDDGGDPDQAPAQASELILDPLVMGAIGHFDDQTTLAAAPVYQEGGVALIAPAITAGGLEDYPSVFRLGASEEALGRAAALFAWEELGARRLAILSLSLSLQDPEGQDPVPQVPKGSRGRSRGMGDEGSGLTQAFVVAAEDLGATVLSYQDVDDLEKGEGFDLVFFGGRSWEGAMLLLRLRGAGIEAPLMGGFNRPYLARWAGEAAEGTLYVTSALLVDDPRFLAGYRELAGTDPGPQAALAYDAAHLLLAALEKAIENDGRPTREGVLAALHQAYQGLTGSIVFDEKGEQIDPPIEVYMIDESGYPGKRLK
ncbi:MAG: branched-chain amino acid ABC transporter substrate-binding protein [Anaerolineae bacterium]